MSLTSEIKDYALDIGYSKVGITDASDFDEFEQILIERGSAYDFWTCGARKPIENSHITSVYPNAKSIIVMVYDYAQKAFPPRLCELMGRIYQARCYFSPPDNINGARLELMKSFLSERNIGYDANLWLPQRWAATRAGVTTFGKNTFAYAGELGSFIVISTLIVDVELDYDTPTSKSQCAPNCTACIDACPTNALYEPYKLNPRRCIAFNNWMTSGKLGFEITDRIPHDIRPLMGKRIHGCDVCQEACPQNRKKLKGNYPRDAFLDEIEPDLTLENILHMHDGFYEARVKPVMYNYIRNTELFQRNAAVAIGNTHDARYLPDLEQELNNDSAMIRTHVAWAIGQIGGKRAAEILGAHLAQENDKSVREEIELALGVPLE